jgi:hypothetical protein
MDEAPSRIEMRRTVERNRRQLSMRSSRTANHNQRWGRYLERRFACGRFYLRCRDARHQSVYQ